MKFLEKWERQLGRLSEERFYLVVLSVLALIFAVVAINFAIGLHRNFLTIACDTAAFQSAIVNTLHGNFFRDTAYDGPNMLGLHSMFIVLLLAPIYAFWPSVDLLFALQILAIYSTVIPLYLVALEILRRPLPAFLIAAAALVSPMFLQMAMAPFHPESWILAAVLWSYYFYLRNQPRAFWISFILAVISGEQAALIYAALGIALLLSDDGIAWRKRYGIWALAAGAGWFLFSTGVLVPLMRSPDQHNLVAYHYAGWGLESGASDRRIETASDLAAAVPEDPFMALTLLLNYNRWLHVLGIVGAPLLLAFLSRRTLILLLPFPVYFLMSSQEFFLGFHAYFYEFAFLAGYLALILFLKNWEVATRLGMTVLATTAFLNVLLASSVVGHYGELWGGENAPLTDALHDIFDKIPPEAAVYSPHRFSAYLSNRTDMVMGDLREEKLDFNSMLESRYGTTNVHSDQIEYIVCDLQNDQCGWRQGGYKKEDTKNRADNLNTLLQTGQWKVFWSQHDVVILQRKGRDNPK